MRFLASSNPGGLIAEHGTGAGIGAAWLTSGLIGGARLIFAERDGELADQSSRLFRELPAVEIRSGDEPYDLLFTDATFRTGFDPSNWNNIIELVKVTGQIVMDDSHPVDLWPPEWDDLVDAKREFALRNPRVAGAEIRTTATKAALIATRVA